MNTAKFTETVWIFRRTQWSWAMQAWCRNQGSVESIGSENRKKRQHRMAGRPGVFPVGMLHELNRQSEWQLQQDKDFFSFQRWHDSNYLPRECKGACAVHSDLSIQTNAQKHLLRGEAASFWHTTRLSRCNHLCCAAWQRLSLTTLIINPSTCCLARKRAGSALLSQNFPSAPP